MGYILSIDQGTTGTTAALIDSETLEFKGKVNREFPQIFPEPGLVEHDLNDIWSSVASTVTEVLTNAGASGKDIKCIGITNQRETICSFDKSGRPLHNAIVWQDRRTHEFCKSVDSKKRKEITLATGLPVDPYFSATKLKWLIENSEVVQNSVDRGDCLFGTIDTFLIFKLSNGDSHVTESSNASRTLLYNIKDDRWDENLLSFFNIPSSTLPKILSSFGHFGETKGLSFLPDGIPITGVLGDQQSALFGQAGIEKGMSKCTYGTGAFYLVNTGNECVYSENGLLTTVAYKEGNKITYALEGSCYIAGAAVQWLRDNLGILTESSQVESLAQSTDHLKMKNVFFLPFFTGLGSPYWIGDSQAAITGLTRDTGKAEIARACLEGICLSINDLLESASLDSGIPLTEMRVDGGAVVNNYLMELQASFSGFKVIRPEVIETTAYGAALSAAVGHGIYSKEDIKNKWKVNKEFSPNTDDYFNLKKANWKSTIKRLYLD